MNKKINESIKFILSEYERLNNKNKQKKIIKSEKETLKKLSKLIGKQK